MVPFQIFSNTANSTPFFLVVPMPLAVIFVQTGFCTVILICVIIRYFLSYDLQDSPLADRFMIPAIQCIMLYRISLYVRS